jgi:hypothetical protein
VEKYKNTLGDSLSNLIGSEGLRTDVNVKFDAPTIAIMVLIIPITVALGILLADGVRKAIK